MADDENKTGENAAGAGDSPPAQPPAQSPANQPAAASPGDAGDPAEPAPMNPVRRWVLIFSALALVLLAWYLVSDRFTPYTTQARVDAFVVPIAPQVAGEIIAVDVSNNTYVKKGDRLAQVDPERYEVAVAQSQAQLDVTVQNLRSSSASVDAAAANVDAARANELKARQDSDRLQRIADQDPGAISQRRLEVARATLTGATANVVAAKANLQQAIEQLGPTDEENPQLLASQAALDQAQLQLGYTRIAAPDDGLVTDLQIDVGNYANVGQPLMTFVAIHDVWIQADFTENNIAHVNPGDRVEFVLDLWPGRILEGKVRSIAFGVSAAESVSTPGQLPTIQTSSDWIRDAQRFPVLIDIVDFDEAAELRLRAGGQASVMIYSSDKPFINALGHLMLRIAGYLSYLY
jgi:multidrug resistance efflux pump